MKHMIFMIIGLSVLLYKASLVGSLQDEGFMGMNEKVIVKNVVPVPIYNLFEGKNFLEKHQFVEYDQTKKRGNIQWNDKEGYRGSIDMVLGSFYYMIFVAPFFIVYFGIKRLIFGFYSNQGGGIRTCSPDKKIKKQSRFIQGIKEINEFLKEFKEGITKKDERNKTILILSLILIILIVIKVNF